MCWLRDGGAQAAEWPHGLLPEAGAPGGQWVGGGAAEVRSDAAADYGRGEWHHYHYHYHGRGEWHLVSQSQQSCDQLAVMQSDK